ncbi:zinc finger protein 30C [Haematobia irritans]|uniref:zinc finger protein 30C n=1 Tax=Haematobia irritans TaxID=7368 RepID=UPI003F4FE5A4
MESTGVENPDTSAFPEQPDPSAFLEQQHDESAFPDHPDETTFPDQPETSAFQEQLDASAATSTEAQLAMLVKLSTQGVPKLFCPICNKALVSLHGYVKHVKKHEPPGGFLCRYCEARFCSDEELKKHRETEHTTIACRLCKDTTFTNEEDYRVHIRDIHNGVDRQLYNCEKCGAAYKTIEPYRRHIENDCGSIKPFKCDLCPMAFVTKYNLKHHKENHSGELKFCCSYCGRNFKQKARLIEHERTHTGEKPYKCDVCGKSFSHRESIVTHSTIHTGIRLIECKCCSSRFSCYSNLIKHRRNRPDTCGQPEYDPPRNRIRKFTSRIPALLNPNTEIKVVNVNKIIKPDDLEKAKAKEKEASEKPKPPRTARKRTGGGGLNLPIRKRQTKNKKRSKTTIEFDDSDDEDVDWTGRKDNGNEEQDSEDKPLKDKIVRPKRERKTRGKPETDPIEEVPITAGPSTAWSDDSEDDYVPDFEKEDDSEEEAKESKDLKFPIKIKQEAKEDTSHLDIQNLDEFEYSTIDTSAVKSEKDDINIFSEKDKILECLLSEGDSFIDTSLPTGTTNAPTEYKAQSHVKKGKLLKNYSTEECDKDYTLEETEVVLVKNEDSDDDDDDHFPLEDMLEVKAEYPPHTIDTGGNTECRVLLQHITVRYPELKTQSTIKVSRNCQPFFSKNPSLKSLMRKANKKRQYRPRGCSDREAPKGQRKSKITGQELRARLKLKKRDKSYQCPHCIKLYYMRKPFERHMREDHNKTDEEIKELLRPVLDDVPTDDVFKCHICDKIYLMEKRLKDHIPKHGPDGSLIHKCPCYCLQYFATREEAQLHAQQAHKDLLWCAICEKFMTGSDALKTHRARLHGSKEVQFKRNLVCDKCGKKFMGRTQLMDHVRSDCGRVPIYQCQVCGKCLTTAGILKTHMLLHQDERPYECDTCGKTFKIKAQYKTHTKFAHSDEKRFKCHLCPKAYPYRESLLTHMSVHTGIKRFLCNGCGKRFTCVSNLQAHRKVHAETCGLLPLNAKATQYMGVQKGNLLLGAKPEPGLDYVESQTLVAKEVYTQDVHMVPDDILRSSQPSNSLTGGLPLNYTTDIILL